MIRDGEFSLVVDAHEDLAWNVLNFGRDYLLSAAETRAREASTSVPEQNGHTLLGWPNWVRGRVAVVFATLFAAPASRCLGCWDTQVYSSPEEAELRYRGQLEVYHTLAREHPERFKLVQTKEDLAEVLDSWEKERIPRVGFVLLMEGADGVRDAGDIKRWYADGVRIVGPAWRATRYAGGTGHPGPFTREGRRLLREMEQLGMVLDVSHLAEEAVDEALASYEGPLIASHSNARALVPGSPSPDRHLSDKAIRAIGEREGVIGVVFYNRFLLGGWQPEMGRSLVPLAAVVEQIDYICQLTGDTRHVGIGSDFDGGFGLDKVPEGIDTVADLRRLGEMLAQRGYSQEAVGQILGGNWLRFLREALPVSSKSL